MAFFKSHRIEIIIGGLLVLVFLFTRLYNLLILPIFTDEAIYLYWGKFIATEHSHWFISLSDGKSPVLTWIFALLLNVFPQDAYLLAGRIVSVAFGFVTLIGIYKLSEVLFQSRSVGYVASFLYIISPFSLLYDRLALYDSQLTAMLIWSVYFAVKTAKSMKIQDALFWGFFLGMGFLAKAPAILFLAVTPLVFLLLADPKKLKKSWKVVVLLLLIVFLISQGINNLQRISGAFQQAVIKNQQFQQPIAEILKDPFKLMSDNMRGFQDWLISYYTFPMYILGIGSFLVTAMRKRREGISLFLLWFFPMVVLATFGREVFPRYLVFITPYVFIAIAFALVKLWNIQGWGKILATIIFVGVSLLPIRFSYLLITDPVAASLPKSDYNQLISEHPSGYGLAPVLTYLKEQAQHEKITVVTQGTFGLYPYSFYLEFWDNPNIRILPKWPLGEFDEEVYDAAKETPVFVVLKEHETLPEALPELQLIFRSDKPGGAHPILLTKFVQKP